MKREVDGKKYELVAAQGFGCQGCAAEQVSEGAADSARAALCVRLGDECMTSETIWQEVQS
ncbi:hypothetical protein [Ferribacterium limneticum]|uniref:hypothetical protein n=1 Tax=Ferribacterium limneticum TaxID=76259 RepID=UPI001CF92DE5|nr:hypothetical protein [Ferribacterium limneticum]UCV26757.1 hypothetical protein KI617_10590 [Ferribacterium limneticum]UCV30674.1 hypothetical protein KI608_10590 [Ferribacterium limneticum]